MCGVHPKVQKYANQIIDEVNSNKKITTNFKGYKLVVNDLEIPINKRSTDFFLRLGKAVKNASKEINKNKLKNKYFGTLIVPEHIKSMENNSLILMMASNMALMCLNRDTNTCGCYHYNFYPHVWNGKGVKKESMPKLKVISFFKK